MSNIVAIILPFMFSLKKKMAANPISERIMMGAAIKRRIPASPAINLANALSRLIKAIAVITKRFIKIKLSIF